MGTSLGYQPLNQGDASSPPPAPAGHPKHPGWRFAVFAFGAGLLALASGGIGATLAVHYDGHTTTVVSAPSASTLGSTSAAGLASVAAAVLPSVVTIAVTTSTQQAKDPA